MFSRWGESLFKFCGSYGGDKISFKSSQKQSLNSLVNLCFLVNFLDPYKFSLHIIFFIKIFFTYTILSSFSISTESISQNSICLVNVFSTFPLSKVLYNFSISWLIRLQYDFSASWLIRLPSEICLIYHNFSHKFHALRFRKNC